MRLVEALSERLKAPTECRELARLVARYHGVIHRATELRASTLLDLLLAADALRRPERLDNALSACAADALSRPGRDKFAYTPARWLKGALEVVRGVDAGAIAASSVDNDELPRRIRMARLRALGGWKTKDGSVVEQ